MALFLWMQFVAVLLRWIVYLSLLNHILVSIVFVILDKAYLQNLPFLQSFYLHPLAVVDGCNFCMGSNLLLNGLMQTLLSFMNIVFPIYCNSVLNSWHFFGDILTSFFNNAFNKSVKGFMINVLLVQWVKNNSCSID